jgi:hypothetical protein
MQSRCREQAVNHRQGPACLGGCAGERTPSFGDCVRHWQNPAFKPEPQIDCKPGFQSTSQPPWAESFNAAPDFSDRQNAQKEDGLLHLPDPAGNIAVGFRPDELRDDVGVQQKTAHRSISRPKSHSRPRSIPEPRSGDAAKNSTRLPLRASASVSRANSSAGSTTTASRPCFVTRWGPLSRASRNTSLKRALAS